MILALSVLGIALFGMGVAVGKEWMDVRYQRQIIDLKKEAQDWKDMVMRRNAKPTSPPWPPGSES